MACVPTVDERNTGRYTLPLYNEARSSELTSFVAQGRRVLASLDQCRCLLAPFR